MQFSLVGWLVCALILLIGRLFGSSLLVGMVASLALGSTAVMTLDAAGGASPLIYIVFAALVCIAACLSKTAARDLTAVFAGRWEPWVVVALAFYAAATAYLMPRLFAGAVNVFVATRDVGVIEVALQPGGGNLTQTGYFILGAFTFIALNCLISESERLRVLRNAFFVWATLIGFFGVTDFVGKLLGLGDVLAPIRTATYAYLTEAQESGFFRIAGSFSEASAFGSAALGALAFTFTYWRHSGSRASGYLAGGLLLLVVLSTSSTAYVGLAIIAASVTLSIVRSSAKGRFTRTDLVLLSVVLAGAAAVLCLAAYDSRLFQPFEDLIQSTLINKADSESGRERSYWNTQSLLTLFDTWGLGVGFGSSRASNWLVAVVSQLGIIGTLLQLLLVVSLLRSAPQARSGDIGHDVALYPALRACALAILLGSLLAGSSADPGMLFFTALAGLTACRRVASQRSYDSLSTA